MPKQVSSDRAGRYVSQPTGYKAFVPKPLPPVPALRLDAELASLLSAADHRLRRSAQLRVRNELRPGAHQGASVVLAAHEGDSQAALAARPRGGEGAR